MSVTDYKLVIVLRENSHKKIEKLVMMPAVCIYFQYFCYMVICNLFVFRSYIEMVYSLCMVFLAHLSHRLMVSYCHQPMSVVRRQQLLQTTSPLKPLSLGP